MEFVSGYSPIPASAYYNDDTFLAEKKNIFLQSWLLAATVSEIPNDGDYIAREFLGVPVIIWRSEGNYKAFVNVCPHRHSLLVPNDQVGFSELLRCPYHGWEFNSRGNLVKIPEAQCFKGLKKEGSLALKPLALEQLENLLFINFAPGVSQNLKSYLGEKAYENLQAVSKRAANLIAFRTVELACNWKLMFENNIEDYHTPLVHKESIGKDLELKSSNFFYGITEQGNGCLMSVNTGDAETGFNIRAPFLTISHFSGLHVTVDNQHHIIATFEQELPISPTTSERRLWLMCHKRTNKDRQTSIKDGVFQVLCEDESLMANNQRGRENAFSPQLLGLYESRIAFFHRFLERAQLSQ